MLKSRWRICLFVVGVALCGVLYFALPAVIISARRDHLVSIVQAAKTVRLEEYVGDGPPLTKHEMNASQRADFVRLLGALPTRGSQRSYLACFIPHHRIVALSSDGSEFTWTICFGCAQLQHSGTEIGEIYGIEKSEYDSLRNLFEENGVPVRTIEEYSNK